MKRAILFLLLLTSALSAKPVLISFDGSGWLDVWEDTLDFGKLEGIPFTYFISAPYFINTEEAKEHPYWAPEELGKKPLIQLRSPSWQSGTDQRWGFINRATAEGHEIASHLVGHYDGVNWTYEQWMKEMKFFKFALRKYEHPIVGIRAPYLGVNKDYYRAAKEMGYHYDSSAVYKRPNATYGFDKEIPIREIAIIGPLNQKKTLPFDCNFVLVKNPNGADMERVFFDSLCHDYLTSPEPTLVCLHFEKVPGDPYMKAMKRFVRWVKDKNPEFMTYQQFAERK
jgi:peptidoglycan/xylan/chitin deacetylase (PgdA/CDA1 family)